MSGVLSVLTLENPAFRGYVFCNSILIVKMMGMSALTGFYRKKNKAAVNSEDAAFFNAEIKTNEDVERVRRAHLNDLENIPIFFMAGLGYLLTNPSPKTALILFKTYTIARIAHTFVYAVVVVPQPARGITWGIGFAITGYMAFKTLKYLCPVCK